MSFGGRGRLNIALHSAGMEKTENVFFYKIVLRFKNFM